MIYTDKLEIIFLTLVMKSKKSKLINVFTLLKHLKFTRLHNTL